jgi:hypothetical protein
MSIFINHTKREIREADSKEIVLRTNTAWSNSDDIVLVVLYEDPNERHYVESFIYDGYDTDPKLVEMFDKRNKLTSQAHQEPRRGAQGKSS